MFSHLTILVAMASLQHHAEVVSGGGVISLKLQEYENPMKTEQGQCCHGEGFTCRRPCDLYFIICLDDSMGSDDIDHCAFGQYTTPTYSQHTVVFGEAIGNKTNPTLFPFPVLRNGLFIKVKVYHSTQTGDDLVTYLKMDMQELTPGPSIHDPHIRSLELGNDHILSAELKVYCNTDSEMPRCEKITGVNATERSADGDLSTMSDDGNGSGDIDDDLISVAHQVTTMLPREVIRLENHTTRVPAGTNHPENISGRVPEETSHPENISGRVPEETSHPENISGRVPAETSHPENISGRVPAETSHPENISGRVPVEKVLATNELSSDTYNKNQDINDTNIRISQKNPGNLTTSDILPINETPVIQQSTSHRQRIFGDNGPYILVGGILCLAVLVAIIAIISKKVASRRSTWTVSKPTTREYIPEETALCSQTTLSITNKHHLPASHNVHVLH